MNKRQIKKSIKGPFCGGRAGKTLRSLIGQQKTDPNNQHIRHLFPRRTFNILTNLGVFK